MSFVTGSATESPYSNLNSRNASARAASERAMQPSSTVGTVASAVGGAVDDVASATVTLSAKAMDALASGGTDVVDTVVDTAEGAADVLSWPYTAAKAVASGVEDVAEQGWHMLSNGVSAAVSGAESLAHAVVIDLPSAIVSDAIDVTKAVINGAVAIAGDAVDVAALGETGGAKLLGSIF
jgi:hypothetical protein